MILLALGLAASGFAALLAFTMSQRLMVAMGLNVLWGVLFLYPGAFAVLNNRAVYDGGPSAPNPGLSLLSLACHGATVLGCALLLARVKPRDPGHKVRYVRMATIGFLILQLLVTALHGTWGDTFGLIVVALVLLVVSNGLEVPEATERRARLYLRLYVLASLVAMGVNPEWALVPPEHNSRALFGLQDRLIGFTDSSNYMGLVAALSFAFEMAATLRRVRYAAVFGFLALAAALLSQSRMPLVAIAIIAVLTLCLHLRLTKFETPCGSWILRGAVCLSALVPLAVAGSTFAGGGSQLERITTGRTTIWEISLQEFLARPIAGYGHDLYSADYWSERGLSTLYANSHNQVLESASRGGILELAGLSIFVLAVLALAKNTRPDPLFGTILFVAVVCLSQLAFGTPFRWSGITWNLIQSAALIAIGCGVLQRLGGVRPRSENSAEGIGFKQDRRSVASDVRMLGIRGRDR